MCGLLALLKEHCSPATASRLSAHWLAIAPLPDQIGTELARVTRDRTYYYRRLMAQQVQAKQRELQSKLEAMLASVEDERLRPMRKQGFLAMAKCCDLSDPLASVS